MEPKTRKLGLSSHAMDWRDNNGPRDEGLNRERERERREVYRTFTQGNVKKSKRVSYFGVESMLLLICLTASLLILPLVLPPLPPPPFLLLLLPIGIFGLLMILAFMPSNVRDLTYTYM